MKRLLPLLLTMVLIAAACGDDSSSTDAGGPGTGEVTTSTVTPTTTPTTTSLDPDTPEGALAAAREQWAARGLTTYRLATSEICFCDVIDWVNTVVDGEVVSHEAVNEGTLFDPGPRSMETLFDEIAAAINNGYAALDVEYHPETGAVVRYYVDVEENVADEEYGVQVTSLTPYDPDAEPVDIDTAALVDDHGCGFGFAKSDAAQTLALFIYWTGDYDPLGPDVSAPIVLPADDWEATMTTGTNLFADWCNDVIEPGAPVPAIDETLTVIAGTLIVDADPTAPPCVGEEVTGVLSGAIAEFSDGTTVELDDVTLRNFGWGCFAG